MRRLPRPQNASNLTKLCGCKALQPFLDCEEPFLSRNALSNWAHFHLGKVRVVSPSHCGAVTLRGHEIQLVLMQTVSLASELRPGAPAQRTHQETRGINTNSRASHTVNLTSWQGSLLKRANAHKDHLPRGLLAIFPAEPRNFGVWKQLLGASEALDEAALTTQTNIDRMRDGSVRINSQHFRTRPRQCQDTQLSFGKDKPEANVV